VQEKEEAQERCPVRQEKEVQEEEKEEALMPARNGKQSPPRPRIEIQSATASPEEAAAIAAALERFLRETAPAPHQGVRSRWQEAALREGVSVRGQLAGGWG
jgi:hypothetical protein